MSDGPFGGDVNKNNQIFQMTPKEEIINKFSLFIGFTLTQLNIKKLNMN